MLSLLFSRTLVRSQIIVDYFDEEISFIAVRETKQVRAEIVSTLAVANRMYSEVEENVPDPSPLSANRKEIETILEQVGASQRVVVEVVENEWFQVSDFQTPSVELLGHLQQGKYAIKSNDSL